jgi:hypothetical protein
MGLATPEVVETLDALDLLDLDAPGPWPGEPDGRDSAWSVDWRSVEEPLDQEGYADAKLEPVGYDWGPVREDLVSRAGRSVHVPPPDLLDALAWYLPIHYHGYGWGIYVREDAVLVLAGSVLSRVERSRREDTDAIMGAVRAGLCILYLHEAFHHKVESFAVRLEVVEHARRYVPYFRDVYGQLRAAQSDELLEEALACAEIVRRMRSEKTYQASIPADIRAAAQAMLDDWLPTLPPGYRKGPAYIAEAPYDKARNLLSSQIHESRPRPLRRHDEWHLMPQGYNGFFDCKSVTHVLVPIGSKPIVPWFGTPAASWSVSTNSMVKLVIGQGYEIVAGGKGSHIKLTAPGRRMIIIPAKRESLSPQVVSSVAAALNLPSLGALRTLL